MPTRTFMDFTVDGTSVGRVIFELFNDDVPKTCENFRALCTGEKGISPLSERPLYYKNTIIHRSIAGFMVQGGDFTKRNGTGGESIYGATFADEDLHSPLDAEGLLCMANKGPDTNGSQFFITLRDCPHLNGKHVVFGKVVRGFEVVQRIAEVPVDGKSRPTTPIVISNCGELELRQKPKQAKEAPSVESDESNKGDHKKRRRHSRSRSRSRSPDGKPDRRKKHREKKGRRSHFDEAGGNGDPPANSADPRQETEEEYDARLEREEKERIAAHKARELAAIKQRYKDEAKAPEGGVRFKGRGRMRYMDPEMRRNQD